MFTPPGPEITALLARWAQPGPLLPVRSLSRKLQPDPWEAPPDEPALPASWSITSMVNTPRGYTPPELARLLRVSPDKVLTWIRTGELPALNLANVRCGRPRFVVLPHHLTEFENRRKVSVQEKTAKPRRKPRRYVKDYYPD